MTTAAPSDQQLIDIVMEQIVQSGMRGNDGEIVFRSIAIACGQMLAMNMPTDRDMREFLDFFAKETKFYAHGARRVMREQGVAPQQVDMSAVNAGRATQN